jgi:hypothetical protein
MAEEVFPDKALNMREVTVVEKIKTIGTRIIDITP